ncbi:hypothetical protein HMPREF1624_07708 [Sporothrix schenckii ATCC 58251]|uniref:Major facilitator superfamily (MFS) profile domain-containing protein n=1 Tax=Sporothrix schenckii (strain ATCC 58251 / de Perez 2211183) TaxID=1391915 RepID=U7PKT1_SPOS1|nr:hypothetical protein HMPREF1624_07708 [Sporothrix schenckii ATCC 58251]
MAEVHDTFVPGTIHLVDVAWELNPDHGRRQERDIVLHPKPSSHADDPLNWSYRRKLLSTLCMFVYAMTICISSAAIYSVLEPISEATNLSVDELNAGTGYMAVMIWAPFTTNKGQWIASKTLQGFFGAPVEALCEISMTDIWFTHERGKYLTIYVLALYIANSIAPLIAAFIAAGQGWKWVLYWCAIYNAVSFLFLFFFMEETNWTRDQTSTEDVPIHNEKTVGDNFDAPVSAATNVDKDIAGAGASHGDEVPKLFASPSHGQGAMSYTKKSYWAKLRLFDRHTTKVVTAMSLFRQVTRPLLYLQLPVVVFCGTGVGCYQMWLSFLNGTESSIMSGSYGFSTLMLGVPFVSPIIFSFIGYLYVGVFGDRFIVRMARRNNGVFEPEHRLWLLLPLVVIAPGSQLLWGLGAYYKVHWIGPVIAMGFISFATVVGAQVCYSYCIDSYRALSGEAIVTVVLLRNNMLFGINYGITPWITNMGLRNAYTLAAVVAFLQVLTFLLMTTYGKRLRARSVKLFRKYCAQLEADGLLH